MAKRISEKGKPMEMRALKAPYGTQLYGHQHKRATVPLEPEPAPSTKALPGAYDELKRRMDALETQMKRVVAVLKGV